MMTDADPQPESRLHFAECVAICATNPEFVEQFDRIMGANLSRKGTGLDLAIDDATGRPSMEARKFIAFVYKTVWTRLPLSSRVNEDVTPVDADLALLS